MHTRRNSAKSAKLELFADLLAAKKISRELALQVTPDQAAKILRLQPLILADKIYAYEAAQASEAGVSSMEKLTPLILTGRIFALSVRDYDEDTVDKLYRLMPLILSGKMFLYEVFKQTPTDIIKLHKLAELINAGKLTIYEAKNLDSIKASIAHSFTADILSGERNLADILQFNEFHIMKLRGVEGYQTLFKPQQKSPDDSRTPATDLLAFPDKTGDLLTFPPSGARI